MIIKILGSGCTNCINLEGHTRKAVEDLGIEAEVVKVENFEEIAAYGVMSTPAIVIDEKVISSHTFSDLLNVL